MHGEQLGDEFGRVGLVFHDQHADVRQSDASTFASHGASDSVRSSGGAAIGSTIVNVAPFPSPALAAFTVPP